ncbi:BlaI/MecI/CopY family transcriptional regulator [Actinopolyspora halophila]|nr:BlaI/MecI/CopY family transcriptional regulator [Actinopolyspora halophila]
MGELELKVMDVLWAADEPLRVRDVLGRPPGSDSWIAPR